MKKEITKSADELLGHFFENSSYLKSIVIILIIFALIYALGKGMKVLSGTVREYKELATVLGG